MSVAPGAQPSAWADAATVRAPAFVRMLVARMGALCLVELQRLRHDRSELYTRAIQPALWLIIFGETFTRLHAIPTGGLPYLDFLACSLNRRSSSRSSTESRSSGNATPASSRSSWSRPRRASR